MGDPFSFVMPEKYKNLYTPRKCSYTNRLITADDHASVQFAICRVDTEGRTIKDKSQNITFAVCGFVRSKAQSDSAVNVLATDAGLLKNVIQGPCKLFSRYKSWKQILE